MECAFDFLSFGVMFVRATTMILDLFLKSWFVAMARQIIIGPQLIFVYAILMFIAVKCSCYMYSDLTLKVIIKVFPQKNNTN